MDSKPRKRAPVAKVPLVEEPRPGFTAIGRVLRAHGIRGELRVSPFSPGSPNLQTGRQIYLAGSETATRIRQSRPDRGAFIVAVNAITDRDVAQSLAGTLVEATDGDVKRDDDESFFVHELIGLAVVTDEGLDLGKVTEVLQMGAADVYVVNGPKGEILFPAIGDVVLEIDLIKQFMRITLLPGLLDESK